MTPDSAASSRVLVVEDDPGHAALIRASLERAALQSTWVGSQADADRALSTSRFDGLIVDISLPDGDGLELRGRLSTGDQGPPLVVVTADETPDSAIRAFECGADGYVIKRPGYCDVLIQKLASLLPRHTSVALERGASADAVAIRGLSLVHRFCKELFWIRTHAKRLRRDSSDDHMRRRVAEILGMSDSMFHAARAFLDYGRSQEQRRETRLLDSLIAGAIERTARVHGAILIDSQVEPALLSIEADVVIEDVLFDLLDNAICASPGVDSPVVISSTLEPRPALRIVDSGHGMSPETLKTCRDLGFTTRSEDGGHGIGLAAACGALDSIGGDLSIASAPGTGTTVTVALPRCGSPGVHRPAVFSGRPPLPPQDHESRSRG